MGAREESKTVPLGSKPDPIWLTPNSVIPRSVSRRIGVFSEDIFGCCETNRTLPKFWLICSRCRPTCNAHHFSDSPHLPAFWNLAEGGILEGVRKEGSGFGIHVEGLAAFGLGADGIETDEPRFEDGAGHGFQRLVRAMIQRNFVVQ